MTFERPKVTDHGSIVEHTFYRCPSGNPGATIPKNTQDLLTDKFGECSHS